jgi:tetratricopeptide (TPR) repeat protein
VFHTEIDPNNSLAYAHFAFNHLLPLGRIEEAIHQMRVAEKIDPLAPEVQSVLAYMLISAGQYDEAAGHCQKLQSRNSDCLGRARLGQGRTGEAIEAIATSARGNRGYLGFAYARAGRREEAEKVADAVSPNPFNQALVYAGLGDKDRTIEALDRLAAFGPVRVGRALNIPEMALLRGDPRVKALRKKAGLPE